MKLSREYVIYYLIYGFVFIAMGIAAWQHGNDEQISNLPLAHALPDLGAFGIIHGLTEWMTMLLATGLFPEYVSGTILLRSFLKVLSFTFFLQFSMRMLWSGKDPGKHFFKLPWVMFTVWIAGLLLMVGIQGDYTGPGQLAPLNTLIMRYGMAIPGGIMAFIAFHRDASLLRQKKRPKQAGRTQMLAWTFLVYGLMDGLFVREASFFPANIINHTAFQQITGLPIQLAKAMAGSFILWGLIRLLTAFREEVETKIQSLVKNRAAMEERRRIGMALHDGIIQKLYASGLRAEYLFQQVPKEAENQIRAIEAVKAGISESMEIVRELLNQNSQEIIEPEDLRNQLQRLVDEYRQISKMNLHLINRIPLLQLGAFSPEQSTHIYYIVQEALCNAAKHACASDVWITLESTLTELVITVRDNGTGFSVGGDVSEEGKGLILMKERGAAAGGIVLIHSQKTGTRVILRVPWEVDGK